MKINLATILLIALSTVGVISLTSSNLSSAAQQMSPSGVGGAFPYGLITSGKFSASPIILTAPLDRKIYVTEIGISASFSPTMRLMINRAATGTTTTNNNWDEMDWDEGEWE